MGSRDEAIRTLHKAGCGASSVADLDRRIRRGGSVGNTFDHECHQVCSGEDRQNRKEEPGTAVLALRGLSEIVATRATCHILRRR